MRVLIVNAFENNTPKGVDAYNVFRELIFNVLKQCNIIDNEIVERSLDNISEFVLDWEHDNLGKSAYVHASNFDKIDFVFIGGDMKISPWEPVATHTVTLIHMCRQTKKSLFASGFGAFCAVYTLATKGARFHILNGPHGEEIEQLSSFPRYSIGTGAYPSGWLDNETGDIYTYSEMIRSWQPVCNIGVFRSASYGAPTSGRIKHIAKKFAHEDRMLKVHQKVEALGVDEDVAHIRNKLLQHVSVRSLPESDFTVNPYADWYLNADGALPSGEGLFVIADGAKGPVLLAKDNMLLFTCRIERSSQCYQSVRTIMANFVTSQELQARNNAVAHIAERSLRTFLFNKDGHRNDTYDSVMNRRAMTSPMASQRVRSSVMPYGPIKVDPPVISMFFQKPKTVDGSVTQSVALQKKLRSSMGMSSVVTVQNPLSARHGRLKMLTARTGYNKQGSMNAVINEALLQGSMQNPTELMDHLPESARELFTGRIMRDHNISTRRHHLASYGDRSEVIYPNQLRSSPLPSREATPMHSVFEDDHFSLGGLAAGSEISAHSHRNSLVGRHSDAEPEEEDELDILDGCFTIVPFMVGMLSADTLAQHERETVSAPAPASDNVLRGSFGSHRQIKTAIAGSVYDDSQYSFPKPDTPPAPMPSRKIHRMHHRNEKPKTTTPQVPIISDWYKAIHSPANDPVTSQSARTSISGHRVDHLHNQYFIQTARSARTADKINSAMNELYLPVKHPTPRDSDDNLSDTSDYTTEFGRNDSHSTTLYSTSQYSSGVDEPRVVLPTPRSGPYNNYKSLAKTIQQTECAHANKYAGYYTAAFVPEGERPLKEYVERKKKFIAGPFLTHFGQARSSMVPGKEGYVRGQGPFPKEPLPGMPEGITAADWPFLKHNEVNRNIAGAWKS